MFNECAYGQAKDDSTCNVLQCSPCGAIGLPQSSIASKSASTYLHVLLHAPPFPGSYIVESFLKRQIHSMVLLQMLNVYFSSKYEVQSSQTVLKTLLSN